MILRKRDGFPIQDLIKAKTVRIKTPALAPAPPRHPHQRHRANDRSLAPTLLILRNTLPSIIHFSCNFNFHRYKSTSTPPTPLRETDFNL